MGKTLAKGAIALLIIAAGVEGEPLRAFAQTSSPDLAPAVDPTGEQLLLGVTLNGQDQDQPRVFLRRNGVLHVRPSDLQGWRIRSADAARIVVDGQAFVPLSALPGARASLDEARQVLRLTVPADLFEATVLTGQTGGGKKPTPAVLAGFLNYDLSLETTEGQARAAGFLEMGVSDDWGLAVNTMTMGKAGGESGRALRLDTYYLYDDPARFTRFVAGDTLTRGTDWSQPIRYGGVRYGTDFGLQPGMLTFPTPAFTGRTSLPSSVELYVNDALRFRGDVDQGPFTLNQTPLVTGAGEVTVVVRDALGVERRVTTSYYVSSRLLRRGLSDYSIEIGAERNNYGVESFDYGEAFAAGSYRRGVTDWLTLESRAEASGKVQNIGGGFSAIWPAAGEFGLAAAVSNSRDGEGALFRAYYSRISSAWNVSVSYQRATDDFAQIGVRTMTEQIRELLSASAGLSFGRYGSIGAAYTDLRLGDQSRTRVGSLNYGAPLGDRAFFNIFALRSQVEGEGGAITVGLGLTIPLGPRSSAYLQADSNNATAEYRRNPPTDQGWGYRLSANQGDIERQEAEVTWRGQPGQVTVQASHADSGTAGRLLATGGMIFAGGGAFATRRVEGGFALVEAPGQANVRIYQENRLVARTDASGHAILPALRAYDDNKIGLAAGDLPLDVHMGGDVLNVVPRFYGGVAARFDIDQDHGGTAVLQLPDGRPVEAGASVYVDGVRTFVGYDGEVFVSAIRQGTVLDVRRVEGACRAVLPSAPVGVVLPRLGPIICQPSGDPR
jgi:outer membrane usher protein